MLPGESDLAALWATCDLAPEVQQGLVQSRLWFSGGRLRILDTYTRREDFLIDISGMILSVWHTETFCGSRWCTVGSSCRSMMRAWVLGFHECLSFLRSEHIGITDYLANGYFQVTAEARAFIIIAALSSRVAEHFLASMLSDNRCARRMQELREDMQADIEDLRAMPVFVWETVASLMSAPPELLQDKVLSAATIAQGYIEHKVLSVCEGYPWKLLHGSLEENLDQLLGLEVVPEEQVCAKVCALAGRGFSRERLLQALQLLSQCSFTSFLVEKMHASAATISRFHPDLAVASLKSRAFCHMFRQMIPSASSTDRVRARLILRRDRILSKNTRRVTGRHVFLARKMQTLAHAHKDGHNRLTQQDAFKLHGSHWHKLSEEAKRKYSAEASTKRAELDKELHDAFQNINERLDMLTQQEQEAHDDDEGSTTMLFSLAPIPLHKLSLLQEYFDELQQNPSTMRTYVKN
eukprot:6492667-Amphidinium_carterae.2